MSSPHHSALTTHHSPLTTPHFISKGPPPARRVFLLHAILFGLVVVVCMPLQPDPSWEFSGWGALRILPFVFTFAPLASVGGRGFEWWARPSARASSDFFSALLMLLVTGGLAAFVVYQQVAVPFTTFEVLPFSSADASALLVTSLLLAVLGLWRTVAEFMPRLAGRRADPDAQLHFEERTKALKHEAWFTRRPPPSSVAAADSARSSRPLSPHSQPPAAAAHSAQAADNGGGGGCGGGRPRLRVQVVAVLKLSTFWGAVFGAKLAFAVLQLVPTLLSAHSALVRTFPAASLIAAHAAPDVATHAQAGSGDTGAETTAADAAFAAYTAFSLWVDAALLLRSALCVGLWLCGATIFLADTLAFYQASPSPKPQAHLTQSMLPMGANRMAASQL